MCFPNHSYNFEKIPDIEREPLIISSDFLRLTFCNAHVGAVIIRLLQEPSLLSPFTWLCQLSECMSEESGFLIILNEFCLNQKLEFL